MTVAASSEQRTREIELSNNERSYLRSMPAWTGVNGDNIERKFDALLALLRVREQETAEANERTRVEIRALRQQRADAQADADKLREALRDAERRLPAAEEPR